MRGLFVLFAAGSVACASAPPRVVLPLAFTECYTAPDSVPTPVSWIRSDVTQNDVLPLVLAHEAEHARQVRMFPSCAAYTTWRNAHRDRAEVLAFCATAGMAYHLGQFASPAEAVEAMVPILSGSYPELELTEPQARALLHEWCETGGS